MRRRREGHADCFVPAAVRARALYDRFREPGGQGGAVPPRLPAGQACESIADENAVRRVNPHSAMSLFGLLRVYVSRGSDASHIILLN